MTRFGPDPSETIRELEAAHKRGECAPLCLVCEYGSIVPAPSPRSGIAEANVWKSITPDSANPFDSRTDPGRYDDYESIRALRNVLAKTDVPDDRLPPKPWKGGRWEWKGGSATFVPDHSQGDVA